MLTDLQSVKTHLQQSTAVFDDLLNLLIPQADRIIKSWCFGQKLELATQTEIYNGSGYAVQSLNQRPVVSVASVYLDSDAAWGAAAGAFTGPNALLTNGIDYALIIEEVGQPSRCGQLCRLNGVWPGGVRYQAGLLSPAPTVGMGNIKVTYTSGFAVLPDDLVWSANQLVAGLKLVSKTGGMFVKMGEGLQEYNYNLGALAKQFPNIAEFGTVIQALGPYRSLGKSIRI